MTIKASSSLGSGKYTKTCVNYNVPLRHERVDGLATQEG